MAATRSSGCAAVVGRVSADGLAGLRLLKFFHGNGGSLRWREERFRALIADGSGFLALSYRGYGVSQNHVLPRTCQTGDILGAATERLEDFYSKAGHPVGNIGLDRLAVAMFAPPASALPFLSSATPGP